MASDPITSWQIDWETMETVRDFVLEGSQITADGDHSHAIKGLLILKRKAMTNLDSVLKSRDITFLTKFHLVKVMVFPVVMYRCESWTMVGNSSASVLPMNIQDWFPLGVTDLIFLQFKGLSSVFKSFLQHHSSKALILQRSTFFMVPLPTTPCHLPSPSPYTLHLLPQWLRW